MNSRYSYQQFFGLSEHPFSITPDPRFVYLSDQHRRALEHLEHSAVAGSGFVLLTGDVGSGKTTICRAFLERLLPTTEVALILNPVLTLNEFLQTICDDLDLVVEGSRESNKNLIDHLNRFLLQVYAVGNKTILIVDEAQNLSQELLEQIRLLTNLESNTDKLLQIFLIGQPELRDMLKRPELLQVSQRITSRFHLGPLSKAETRGYIRRRLAVAGGEDVEFTSSAVGRVYAFSKGVPRLINVVCDRALLTAYQHSAHRVDNRIVQEAEQQVLGAPPATRGGIGRWAMALGIPALVAVLALGAAYWANPNGLRPWLDDRLAGLTGVAGNPAIAPAQTPAEAAGEPPEPPPTRSAVPPTPGPGTQVADSPAPETAGNPSPQVAAPPVDGPDASPAPSTDPADATARDSEVTPLTTAPAASAPGADAVQRTAAPVVADAQPTVPEARPTAPAPDETETAAAGPDAIVETQPDGAASMQGPPADAGGFAAADYPEPAAGTLAADESLIDYTRQYAERKLLSLWGIAAADPADLDFCSGVTRHGLDCLSEASGLAGLNRYDRPAILFLTIGQVSSYAVMLQASPERVVLDVLDREHVIPADALADVWDGRFLLLWRKPGGIEGNLTLGAEGQPAVWLRRAIDRIEGVNTSGQVFDEPLLARVKQFQRSSGLVPDGIVGPRTLILLQNKLAMLNG